MQLLNNEKDDKYINNVPPNLDEEPTYLFYKQRYALMLVFLFIGVIIIFFQVPVLRQPVIIGYVVLGVVCFQVNPYYTLGFAMYRYVSSMFIEPLEYLKKTKKERGGTLARKNKTIRTNKAKKKNHQKKKRIK